MFGNTIGKLVVSFLIVAWALLNLFPIKDKPFKEYLKGLETADASKWHSILEETEKKISASPTQSFYVALNEVGREKNLDFAKLFPNLKLADIPNQQKRNEVLTKHLLQASQGKVKLGLDLKGGVAFTLKVDDAALVGKENHQKKQMLSKAIDIMERRVNGLGVAEPILRERGKDAIEIQLPGLTTQENPDVLENLKRPAKLTFHKVYRTAPNALKSTSGVPIGYEKKFEERTDPKTGEMYQTPYFIKKIPEMGGKAIKEAFVTTTQFGAYEIILKMTTDGAKRFETVTQSIAEENNSPAYANLPEGHPDKIGKLAIVLDGELYSAPQVRNAIPGGVASITGQFSQREAFELANVLNNPLEFELKLAEMYEVGPTLASDARNASVKAAMFGAGLVIFFMIFYYLSAGAVAVTSILFNVLIVLGVLASLGFTLTLPGVGALVLTIGMAVDSNILIFERIREELNLGKNLAHALEAGYEKAFSTIVDANVTTLLTAAILIWLGTGPVKGFGVTLAIGIGATLICTLILSRALLDILVKFKLIKRILLVNLFKESTFDFLSVRRWAFIFSWAIVLIGVTSVYLHRDHIWGIDFVGGDEVSIEFKSKLPLDAIYKVAQDEQVGEVIPSYQSLIGSKDHTEILKIQTRQGLGLKLLDSLKYTYPEAQLKLVGENTIGSSLSESIKKDAILAMLVALLGILLYVALRFELGYGIGAIVSTVHDVLMSIGLYVLLGGQFTAPMVAAILMIVGYSINDTIVVFDRIREELSLNPTFNLKTVVNLAINKTLSRTLLTSLTTLIAAVSLFIFGAGVIKDFALVFIIGILTGTFSSIFIASPIFYWWHKGDRKHVEARELKPKYVWEEKEASSK